MWHEQEGTHKISEITEQLLEACLAEDPKKTTGIGGDNMTCLVVELKKRTADKA